ncbi:MAG: hypothetical protein WC969_09440 [Elusimicrobiota bacterium]|jgi:hypothetical protein
MTIFNAALVFAALLLPAREAAALGLSTTMGRVFVNNVPVGSTVSVRDLSGVSYKLTNTSMNAEDVEIAVLKPSAEEGILLPGYEPIPDAGWVWLSQNRFHLAPGQQAVADVMIDIPKDPKHLAKKYQVSLWARSVTEGRFLAVGLKSRLMLDVSSRLMTADEMKRSDQIAENLDFHFSPPDLRLADVPLGRSVDVRKELRKSFKLINLSDKPMRIKLKPIARVLAGLGSAQGVLDDVGTVTPEKPELVVPANSIGIVGFSIKLPDDRALAGKKCRVVLQAELQDQAVPVSAFGQITLDVKKEGDAR